MPFICKNCYEEFKKPAETSSRMGLAWLIFIIFSLGIGLIFWLFMSGQAKEICPHCKSESFVRTDSRAGIILLGQLGIKPIINEVQMPQSREYIIKDARNSQLGMFAVSILIIILMVIARSS
jgi:hypothetical protein